MDQDEIRDELIRSAQRWAHTALDASPRLVVHQEFEPLIPPGKFVLDVLLFLRVGVLPYGECCRDFPAGDEPSVTTAELVSANGKRAVTADIQGEIRVWDVDDGTGTDFGGPNTWVNSLCLNADSRTVLIAGEHQGHTLWMMDTATGAVLRTFDDKQRATTEEDRSTEVQTARLSADGRYAVSAGEDGIIRLWATDTGRRIAALEGHTDEVTALALTPDNKHLLSAGRDHTLRAWTLDWATSPLRARLDDRPRETTLRHWATLD